ncbi:MAG: hypothetical protein K9G44_07840 [Melioribacteraceae bacterium]|nr:hypothetical protein [Melioribacteraceae bacterium]
MKNKAGLKYLLILFFGIFAGILIHKYQLPPYVNIKNLYNREILQTKHHIPSNWSIGLFEGESPLAVFDQKSNSNPIITGEIVKDRDSSEVADPFLIVENNKYYLFFEVYSKSIKQADIGLAISKDLENWEYQKIILDEDFHLSYPNVFKYQNEWYMIPESSNDFSVRLYKAINFPFEWKFEKRLLSGYRFGDPTIFQYENKWWMFVATTGNDALNLYYSNELEGPWTAHAMNPLIKNDPDNSRPAGKIFTYENKIYRFAQDDFPEYGNQVWAFEITQLSAEIYSEKIFSENPIIKKSGKGWNALGMHHFDPHFVNGKWIAFVDGFGYPEE